MTNAIYFFIDGGYVRKRYAEAMNRVFGEAAEPDISNLHKWSYGNRFGNAIPQRFFYYDCLDDIKKDSETDDQFKMRVQHQTARFERIQSLAGFHIRLGSLSGKEQKTRQKKVDVLLAVEMLDHAFRKNMDAAFLLSGDGDFAPLVDGVTRLGTWVEVYYEPSSISKDLLLAADLARRLTCAVLWSWSSNDFQARHPLPQWETPAKYEVVSRDARNVRNGKNTQGETVILAERGDKLGEFFLYTHAQDNATLLIHNNADVLKKYYNEQYGTISWENPLP